MFEDKIDELTELAWESRKSDLRNSFEIALKCYENSSNQEYRKGIAASSKVLGYCYWRFSDYPASLKKSVEAIDVYRAIGDKKGEADTLNSIGAVYMFQQEHEKRLECNQRCLQLRREVGDIEGAMSSQNNLGETFLELNRFEEAIACFDSCISNADSKSDVIAWANHNLGRIKHLNKDFQHAEFYFLESLKITEGINYNVLTGETYLRLCALAIDQKDYEKGKYYAEKVKILSEKTNQLESLKEALLLLAVVYEAINDLVKALKYHKRYHEVYVELFNADKHQKIKDIGFQYEIDKISEIAEIEKKKNEELAEANNQIEIKNDQISEKNRNITDSIQYAKQIQMELLKPINTSAVEGLECALFYRPKDIVSGDFYWSIEKSGFLYIAIADCTGHGVPGAFLTMLGTSFLNEIAAYSGVLNPSEILDELRVKFSGQLGEDEFRNGMDMSLLRIEIESKAIQWAGAISSLWIYRRDLKEIEVFPGNDQSICYTNQPEPFTNVALSLRSGDQLCLFSDGYPDQFGGPRNKKFMRKQLKAMLTSIAEEPLDNQIKHIETAFDDWKGDEFQVDDVSLLLIQV